MPSVGLGFSLKDWENATLADFTRVRKLEEQARFNDQRSSNVPSRVSGYQESN